VEAAGPLVSALSWRAELRCGEGETSATGTVRAESRIEVVGDASAIRYRIALDNQARNHRLRLRLPTGIRKAAVLAGAQFGSIARAAVKIAKAKGEWPVATAPAHRWVAAAKQGRGLALFAPGFFEYEWTAEGDLLVTLLRAVGELSRGDLPSRPGHAGWPTATPLAQCLGTETIELGVAPIRETDLAHPERLERIWEDLFVPPVARWIRESTALPVEPSPTIDLEGDGLVFSSCTGGDQPGELVLRCFNQASTLVEGAWRFSVPIVRVRRVRADGTILENLPTDDGDPNRVRFPAGKKEILTFNIILQCASPSFSRLS
jgi:alpha-mannosidase